MGPMVNEGHQLVKNRTESNTESQRGRPGIAIQHQKKNKSKRMKMLVWNTKPSIEKNRKKDIKPKEQKQSERLCKNNTKKEGNWRMIKEQWVLKR